MNREKIIRTLIKTLSKEEEILFAYLYGSYAADDVYFRSDIDVAVYLKPSGITHYLKKEEELTFALAKGLHRDDIDLRILNALPFLMQYKVIKEGMPIVIRDELERVDFETRVMNRYFELKPYLEEYDRMLTLRIEAGI